MNTMLHAGYLAEIELDEEANLLRGVVINATQELLFFSGTTVADLRVAFAAAVDDYHNRCAGKGIEGKDVCAGSVDQARHQTMIRAARLKGRTRPGLAYGYMTLQEANAELLSGLFSAKEEFERRGDSGREGVKLACSSVAKFINWRWEDPLLAIPFHHVFMALADLQRGRYPELFDAKGAPRVKSRSAVGHFLKAFAAAILEVMVTLSKQNSQVFLGDLAKTVAKGVAEWPYYRARKEREQTDITAATIINWRTEQLGKRPDDRKEFDTVVAGILNEANPEAVIRDYLKNGPPGLPMSR